MKFNNIFRAAMVCAGVFTSMLTVTSASAAAVFIGSSGTLAGSATFDIVGSQLKVVLANTSLFDVLMPADVLTALFFNVAAPSGLSPVSATSGGPTYLSGVQVSSAGANVGGEWSFDGALIGAPGGVNSGLSSSGLGGVFGQPNFNGPNLSGPVALGGLEYGITSAGDDLATGNGGIAGNEITKNSVTFLLNIGGAFNLNQISAVSFQYGTALDEPRYSAACLRGTLGCGSTISQAVPEPTSFALMGLGLLAAVLTRRRRMNNA